MDALVPFTLPLMGLRNGIHEYDFHIDREFFSHFENSLLDEADINLRLTFDKRPDLIILTFDFEGTAVVECDRCLEFFELPIEGSDSLMVKYDETEREEDEVIFIPAGTQELNVAKFAYEFICLAIPMIKTHEEAGLKCNDEMTKFLGSNDGESEAENPVWEVLKKFNNN